MLNRTLIPILFPARPAVVSATVDSTGLLLTVVFDRATSAGVGSPTATADGSAITLTYSSGAGTNTWVYAITSGNPSGDPVLAGAVVLLSAAAGVWTAGGVPSAAVTNAAVTNNSTVLTPAGIAGLKLWLDASVIGTLYQDAALTTPVTANDDPVGGWSNLSGDAWAATSSLTARPLYKTGVQNGLPALLCDGSNDLLLTTDATACAALKNVGGATLFAVMKWVASPALTQQFFNYSDGSTTAVRASMEGGVTANKPGIAARRTDGGGASRVTSATSVDTATFGAWAGVINYTAGTGALYLDGASQVSGALTSAGSTSNTNSVQISIGANSPGTSSANVYLCELLCYNSALGATARARVEAYLRAKWSTP
jgi:hypothetical protein